MIELSKRKLFFALIVIFLFANCNNICPPKSEIGNNVGIPITKDEKEIYKGMVSKEDTNKGIIIFTLEESRDSNILAMPYQEFSFIKKDTELRFQTDLDGKFNTILDSGLYQLNFSNSMYSLDTLIYINPGSILHCLTRFNFATHKLIVFKSNNSRYKIKDLFN